MSVCSFGVILCVRGSVVFRREKVKCNNCTTSMRDVG